MRQSIKTFAGKNILLIGDVMLDRYVYGSASRICPEAPVAIHLKESESVSLGGAGTVLRNLASLGANTKFLSVIGDDHAGHEVTRLVGEVPNTESYLITEAYRPTTVKTRFIAGHHQMARADEETCSPISDKTNQRLTIEMVRNISSCDIVILSDYGKGIFKTNIIQHITAAAKASGKSIIVDPKSDDFSLYSGATVITPNVPELNKATKNDCDTTDSVVRAATDLIRKYNISDMLVTRGKDGMTLVMGNGEVHNIPSAAKEVYDVTGAGDTVVAVLALAMASGLSLLDAAYIANVAAGMVVGKIGTATVTPKELEDAL